MKREERVEVYYCDFCGERVGLDRPVKMLRGSISGSRGVLYEPKVQGDYCDTCLNMAQQNWDDYGQNGFVGERYDTTSEKQLEEEFKAMKTYKERELDRY